MKKCDIFFLTLTHSSPVGPAAAPDDRCYRYADCASCAANTNGCQWCDDKKCISANSNCSVVSIYGWMVMWLAWLLPVISFPFSSLVQAAPHTSMKIWKESLTVCWSHSSFLLRFVSLDSKNFCFFPCPLKKD